MVNELVKRLSKDKQMIIIGYRDESYSDLKRRLEDGYIYVKFTQTIGGTELGINVDLNKTNIKEVDFNAGKGLLHIEGTTNLNYNEVKCISDIDLKTRKGHGYLQFINQETTDAE